VKQRLAFKLILSLTVIVVLVEGISGIINVRIQERQLLSAMRLGVDQLSRAITSATWHAMLADHRTAAYEVMQTIALKQGIRRIRIFNKEGRVMFSTDPNDDVQVDKDAEACSMCHSTLLPLVRVDVPSRTRIFTDAAGKRQMAMVTPIYNEPACSQAACHAHPPEMNVLGVLDVVLSLDAVDQEVAEIEWRGALAVLIHVILIGLFIVFFSRHFVDSPIRKLIEGTRAVSEMNLDRPIEVGSGAELGELAKSFNIMRERLKEAISEINLAAANLETKVEERTAQLQLANQKLVQSDRLASLGKLAASVAHEINNPLSGVLNLAMLMRRVLSERGLPPERLEEFRNSLDQITRETSRIGRIVSDLLAFSRQSKPRIALTDLNQIIRSTLSLVAHKLRLSNVEVVLKLDPGLPQLMCDGSQIQQVVMNLLMNGAEAAQGRPEGRVTIETAPLPGGRTMRMSVTDNGEGIPPEYIARIFDPFFTTKEEGKGVGLGLAVVYGIVDAHQGEIEVDSRVGEGTTFHVTLPVNETLERSDADSVGLKSQSGFWVD